MAKDDKKPTVRTLTTDADIQHKVAMSSKVIVADNEKRKRKDPTHAQVQAIMQDTTTRINDNKGLMELLPDIKLVMRVLVSSILSPKDLISTELGVYFEGLDFDKELPGELANDIATHFSTTYNLESKLSEILSDSLFLTGSYIAACLPESTIEAMVQSGWKDEVAQSGAKFAPIPGFESYEGFISHYKDAFSSNGILGATTPKTNPILTAFEVSDNFNFLKTRTVHREIISNNIGRGLGLEGYTAEPLITLGRGHGADVERGRNPLVQKWPSDSVLPVHTPSNPKDHLGYFVLVDSKGNIVSRARGGNYLKKLREQLLAATNKEVVGSYLAQYKLNITQDSSLDDVRGFVDKAAETIEDELLSQLKDGVYGEEVEVSRPQEVYMLMLSRMLEQKKTRLIYVPRELVTYFAFEYDDLGIGISLLENTKVFAILRAVLTIAEVMSGVSSAIGTKRLDITVDEDDPNWRETVELIVQEFANLQTDSLPMTYVNAGDIVKSLQKSAIDVQIEGGDFPKTNSTVSDIPRNQSRIDPDLREFLKRQQYSGLGVSPEIVDASLEGDLATLVNSRNLQHAKQVKELSDIFKPMLSEHMQVYTRCSGELTGRIAEALRDIEEEATPENIGKVIRAMRARLPEMDMARHRGQAEAYTEYKNFVEEISMIFINEEAISDFMEGDVEPRTIENLRQSFVSLVLRDWMRRENLFPEVEELFYSQEPGQKMEDRISDHNADLIKALGKVIAKVFKSEDKVQAALDKINQPEEEVTEGDGGDTGGDPWSGGWDEEADAGTGDDLGEGTDLPEEDAGGEEGDGGDSATDDAGGDDNTDLPDLP